MAIYVFLNGSVDKEKITFLGNPIEEIIAVDGGFNNIPQHLKNEHIKIIGDLDSIKREYQGYEVIKYPKEKDFSDFELALNYISATYSSKEIKVYGFLGGRIDHQLFNFFVLGRHIEKNNFMAYGDREIIYFSSGSIDIDDFKGSTFSVFPLSELTGLNIKGAKYPLENQNINTYSSLTLSNVITDSLHVSVATGKYALIINIKNDK